MDGIKVAIGLVVSIIIGVFVISRFNGLNAGAFTIFIALGVFLAVVYGVMYGLGYFNHKAEEKIKDYKNKKKLEKKELWKNVPEKKQVIKKETTVEKKGSESNELHLKEMANNMFWTTAIQNLEMPEDLVEIINSFLIKDKIDFLKYGDNERVNIEVVPNSLDIWKKTNTVLPYFGTSLKYKCTPTFKKYFSNDIFERSMGVEDWFTIAYPDVEHWFRKNMDLYGTEIRNNETLYFTDGKFNNKFYRYVIDTYKNQTNLRLECSVDNDIE